MQNIINIEASELLHSYYLDYGMSVITDRSLPDIRDNLKPVQRRVLYDAYDLGITSDKPYKKCARIVGDTLGRFHAHGDSSVYGALCRLAQWFSLREPLIDPHGNVGKIDGSPASAMRYTESRLSKFGELMLRDINKNTVDFMPNFDGEEKEPVVLPSAFPNFLVNGNMGMAVGFSTNIPPHNLSEAIEQIIYQIDNPNCEIKELVDILKAPDFPTGGEIINPKDMYSVYNNGEGNIIVRGKYHIEDENKIVFTEIPYGADINTNKITDIINDCAFGYYKKKKNKKTEEFILPSIPQIIEVNNLTDEIDGIRIEIVIKNKSDIKKVLALLFKKTPLQSNFCSLFNAVKDKKLLEKINLKQINKEYIDFRKEVTIRRSQFDLDKALDRNHIVEGLLVALNNIDKIISIIKKSSNNNDAKTSLMNEFNLSEKQSLAIIEMKLRRLTGLEINKIQEEHKDLIKQIEYLNEVLSQEIKLLEVIKLELLEIQNKFGTPRKTKIIYEDEITQISQEELIEDYNCRIFYTNKYIKKHLKQSDNHKIVEGNTILGDFTTTNKSTLLIFTNKERRYRVQCSDLEQYQPSAHGTFVPKLLGFEDDEEIIKIVSVEKPTGFILIAYESGDLAKIKIDKYLSSYKKLEKCYSNKSKILDIYYSEKDVDILMVSDEGKAIIFNSSNFNAVGSTNSQGNVGMKLNEGNKVISAIIDIDKEFNFELQTQKGKNRDFMLSDIAPTNKSNEERTLYTYLYSKRGNQGNFLINTRTNQDEVIELIVK